MGFQDEIVKKKRKLYPYISFERGANALGTWLGPDERNYASAHEGTYRTKFKGTVLTFGSFTRAIANAMFGLEIPTISSLLMDPEREWREYGDFPHDALLRKWVHYLLRVHDDSDEIYDGTVAVGETQKVSFPPGRKVSLQSAVPLGESLGPRIPRRLVTLNDWPKAPPESVGKAVPIIYGGISNDVSVETEEVVASNCCPIWRPPPGSYDKNPLIPTLRFSDDFSLPEGEGNLERNYIRIIGMELVEGAGELPGTNAVVTNDLYGYGEITRGVGPQIMQLGAELQESYDAYPLRFGEMPSQYGAAGMRRYWQTYLDTDASILEVWGRHVEVPTLTLISVVASSTPLLGANDTDLLLYVSGHVGRPNGAVPWETVVPGDPRFYHWQTPASRNVLIPEIWQTIEIKWKISSRVAETGGAFENQSNYAADGWVQLLIDGQVVCYLQEILFALTGAPGLVNLTSGYAATPWQGVKFSPVGKATCVYVTDRLLCSESIPITIDQAAPCAQNVGVASGGAFEPILVDHEETTMLVRASGIQAVSQDNSAAPQNAAVFVVDNPSGGIPAGVQTNYRVTAVKNGVESSWSGLQSISYGTPYAANVEWDDPSTGTPDYFRVYQMTSDDLQLHQDMGGSLRAETFYVKQVSAVPNGGTRTYQVKFSRIGDGAPMQAAKEETSSETSWLVAGHTMHSISGVFAPLPTYSESPGGLNLFTGEKEPITFIQGPVRMTRLTEGVDYEVVEVEKDSGRCCIIKVTRDLRSGDTCQYSQITCNVEGIEDDDGNLLDDGPLIVEHFLLNWVFNSYETGEWFHDVERSPGIVNRESFATASEHGLDVVDGGIKGAVALTVQADIRSLISEALASFGLDFYYRNAVDNNNGAWSVMLFDYEDLDLNAYPVFEQNNHIVEESFQVEIVQDFLVNALSYKAGPQSGTAGGWLVTGLLTDDDSIERLGRVEREFLMPWTRHGPTATFVAMEQLRLRKDLLAMGSFRTALLPLRIDPGMLLRITHKDGLGATGWDGEVCRMIGHTLDMDQVGSTVKFMSVRAAMGA